MDKSSLARGRRSSREKGNQGVVDFRFINILQLFSIFFFSFFTLSFFSILFLTTKVSYTQPIVVMSSREEIYSLD